MNIGSLYRVKERYWILFPSKELVSAAADEAALTFSPVRSSAAATAAHTPTAEAVAAYYSQEYKENVTYFSPDSYIVFLEEDGNLRKVLTSDGLIGWTWFKERFNDCFEEVKSQ